MKEDFLHYVWKFQKFSAVNLKTNQGEHLKILKTGQPNQNAGPDFLLGELLIDHRKWVGQIEIHLKSSDWIAHGHEEDLAYDNVILHVVWEHDLEIKRKDGSEIPVLELNQRVDPGSLQNYQKLFSTLQKWINCEDDLPNMEPFLIQNWLERLYIERLEAKAESLMKRLEKSKFNWEAVLFEQLCKNFGMKLNGEAFLSLAESIPYNLIQKLRNNATDLESLLMGQTGLLEKDIDDPYYVKLQVTYAYIKVKYPYLNKAGIRPKFFRLRPVNFPTIRISQLCQLWSSRPHFFAEIIDKWKLSEFYILFEAKANSYWDTHYNFGKKSKEFEKKLTTNFIDNLIVNTVLPLKFCYARFQGKDISEEIIALAQTIKAERNTIISKYSKLFPFENSTLVSQGLLQLHSNYCKLNNCINCAIGNKIIGRAN
ncbi:MAG: DUF2851 family protein [Flavobacteriaceae bacterium]|nr:DUF2851 family protein [Flavobacteriaceae bacterium]